MPNRADTHGYVMNQTMLRIRDPEVSVAFYRDVLGMTLLDRYDFEQMSFSLYFPSISVFSFYKFQIQRSFTS